MVRPASAVAYTNRLPSNRPGTAGANASDGVMSEISVVGQRRSSSSTPQNTQWRGSANPARRAQSASGSYNRVAISGNQKQAGKDPQLQDAFMPGAIFVPNSPVAKQTGRGTAVPTPGNGNSSDAHKLAKTMADKYASASAGQEGNVLRLESTFLTDSGPPRVPPMSEPSELGDRIIVPRQTEKRFVGHAVTARPSHYFQSPHPPQNITVDATTGVLLPTSTPLPAVLPHV